MSRSEVSFAVPGKSEAGRGVVVRPAGEGPHPGVLVLHELLGLNDDIERIATEFAKAGYVAFAPDYFGAGFRLKCIVSAFRCIKEGSGQTFEVLEAAHDWLRSQVDVAQEATGVVGFCMGGSFAVLHAARTEASAVAMFYGEVPKDHGALTGIPPCVAGFGGRDKLFGKVAPQLETRLDGIGVQHDVVTYPDAGHSYMSINGGVMAKVGKMGPMNVGYNPEAAADSWERMLNFFGEHLVVGHSS